RIYIALCAGSDSRQKALVSSDLAAIAALVSDCETALEGFREALALDPQCQPASFNLTLLQDDLEDAAAGRKTSGSSASLHQTSGADAAGKVAILSFFFNWPSSGGGNIHTVELCRHLTRAGFKVRHFYPRFEPWDIGNVQAVPFASEAIEFMEG